ncbi:MAG: hypothetical protein ACLQAH_13445 [Limisphaerales bacterium]
MKTSLVALIGTRSRFIVILVLAVIITTAWSAKGVVQVTLNSITYNETDVLTNFTADEAQLTSQPEWGSSSEAVYLASEVGIQLGLPNISGGSGPFFAYGVSSPNVDVALNIDGGPAVITSPDEALVDSDVYYAILTPVPEPSSAAILLSLSVLGLTIRNFHRQVGG